MLPYVPPLVDAHLDVVEAHNRFSRVVHQGSVWNLSHLNAFALRIEVESGLLVDVVVLFSCHCFTHSYEPGMQVLPGDLYRDAREVRVLSPERYRLSQLFLPRLIVELPARMIKVEAARENFFTLEATNSSGVPVLYAVFFSVEKDRRRSKRLLLRVQSAYPLTELNKRQRNAVKVRFPVLLRALYQGRKIRG